MSREPVLKTGEHRLSEGLAPIALFAFRRPLHLRRVVEALRANDLSSRSPLYVFCDAARNESDFEAVEGVRSYVDGIQGFLSVQAVYRDQNLGLARSIISGVTDLLEKHHSVIVLEDDLVTSPNFLTYMNEALHAYRDEARVASIHGYVYPIEGHVPETFFLRGADCWGWATWPRAWKEFNPNSQELLEHLERRCLMTRFDMDGSFGFVQMLRDHIAGKNDSWAVRWHAAAFLKDMLTLYPARSLVENIGLDSSGTHCGSSEDFGGAVGGNRVDVVKIPAEEHEGARLAFVRYFRGLNGSAAADEPVVPLTPPPSPPLRGLRGWLRRRWIRVRSRGLLGASSDT